MSTFQPGSRRPADRRTGGAAPPAGADVPPDDLGEVPPGRLGDVRPGRLGDVPPGRLGRSPAARLTGSPAPRLTGSPAPRLAGARDRAAPHRRRALITVGAVVALAGAALGLGYLLTSGGPLSILDLAPNHTAASVTGTPGLAPDAAGVKVTFLVSGPGPAARVTLTELDPDAASLPLACPPQAWAISLAAPVRVVVGPTPISLTATVSMTDDAPAGCQGVTVGVLTATVMATGADGSDLELYGSAQQPITAATLGTPGVAVTDAAGQAVVVVTADPGSPRTTHYTVEAATGDDGWVPVCQLAGAVPCATGHRSGDDIRYRVTARLGAFWRRTSATIS